MILRTFSKQINFIFTASQGSWQQCKAPRWCNLHVTFPRGAAILCCVFPKLLSKPIGNIVKASFVQRKAVAAVLCCPLSAQMPPCTGETTISLAAAVLPGASTSSSVKILILILINRRNIKAVNQIISQAKRIANLLYEWLTVCCRLHLRVCVCTSVSVYAYMCHQRQGHHVRHWNDNDHSVSRAHTRGRGARWLLSLSWQTPDQTSDSLDSPDTCDQLPVTHPATPVPPPPQTAAMCNRHVLNKLKISSNFQRAFCEVKNWAVVIQMESLVILVLNGDMMQQLWAALFQSLDKKN